MCIGIDKYLLRQTFVLFGIFFQSMSGGVMLAFPSSLNPSLLSPNGTDIRATVDQASLLAASDGVTIILGLILITPFIQQYGRKTIFLAIAAIHITKWTICIFATNFATLFAVKIIGGLGSVGYSVSAVVISEYSHRTRRGYFTGIHKVFMIFGALVCHGLTLIFTWRQIAGVALMFSVLSVIIILFWPESPTYLAIKGRFEECQTSFVWLNGNSVESQKELKELISAQKERLEKTLHEHEEMFLRRLVGVVKNRGFLKSFLTVCLLGLVLDTCGGYYFMAYLIQIMTEVTGDKTIAAYCSIGADVLIIAALLSSCFVIQYFKRRTLLLGFGGVNTFLMFSMGLLKFSLSQFGFVKWLIACILLLQNFVLFVSVIPVCFTLIGELFPLEYRGVGSSLSGVIMASFFSITMMTTPMLMDRIGIEGTYATYGMCTLISLVILYFILIETKDRTLQDIDDEIKGVKRSTAEEKLMLEKS